MIKIENIEVTGFGPAIRGMRNPMNSWDKSDSKLGTYWGTIDGHKCIDSDGLSIGPNDLALMQKLIKAGTDHSKFMRMINVTMDITAPLYWWKEFDTYKVGTVANSCSTMHKIADKEFTLEDFSHDNLIANYDDADAIVMYNDEYANTALEVLDFIIDTLNQFRKLYLKTKDKKYWWQMIQLLPSSYNQRRTVQLNYAVLRNIYFSRRNHKLDEWVTLCNTISDNIPYGKELICLEQTRGIFREVRYIAKKSC